MGWLILGLAVAAIVLVATSYVVWRRWIEPWREVEELVHDIAAGRAPRKFLMSANRRAREIGLALEPLAGRHRELERNVQEGSLSLQTILAALPDGLVVVDDRRRAQMVNPEFRRVFGIEDNASGVPLLELIRDVVTDRLLIEALESGEPRCESIQVSRVSDKRLEIDVSAVRLSRKLESNARRELFCFAIITQIRRWRKCGAILWPTFRTNCARRFRFFADISKRCWKIRSNRPANCCAFSK